MRCNQDNPSIRTNETIRAFEAIIEDVNITNRTGYVTISYGEMGPNCMIHIHLVTLIVTNRTKLRNRSGRSISVRDLRKGMIVDALFSTRMTFSIPPQSSAYRITVVNEMNSSMFHEDRILNIDTRSQILYTGNPTRRSSIIKFIITDSTIILNRRGNRIRLNDLNVGQRVRIEHASFMTASIPPQTTAIRIQLL